jgi:hypothetical protein
MVMQLQTERLFTGGSDGEYFTSRDVCDWNNRPITKLVLEI